jgi:hypothetical protein
MKRYLIVLTLVFLSTGCEEDPTGPILTTCDQLGREISGTHSYEAWRPQNRPYVLRGPVLFTDSLVITPGVVVCAMPGASLTVEGQLIAHGTQDQPVRFIPADSAQSWGGITLPNEIFVKIGHARLRFVHLYSSGGISAHSLDIEDSWIRGGDVHGCSLVMRRSVLDSANAGLAGGALEDNLIRGGSVEFWRPTTFCGGEITLNGGRIEGSPGVALYFNNTLDTRNPTVQSTRPVRIVGSRGYPVSITSAMFKAIWPTPAAQDSLLGNVNDTLVIQSDVNSIDLNAPPSVSHLYVRRDLPIKLRAPQLIGFMFPVDTLTVEPGATLVLDRVHLVVSGKALVRGTTDMPIRISNPYYPQQGAGGARDYGIRLRGSGESEFSNVVLAKVFLTAIEQHAAKLSRIRSDHWINLAASGSDAADVEINDVAGDGLYTGTTAALRLAAPGIAATRVIVRRSTGTVGLNSEPLLAVDMTASDVTLTSCEISDNGSVGVRVNGNNVHINECNIERNGDVGVSNTGSPRVDARRNWWGDPAGPLGPNGDGVSGDVDYSEHRTTPMPEIVFRLR